MRTAEIAIYQFSELSDGAKERARDWYREGALDYDWWDSVYDDAAQIADILGINLRQKPVRLMNGATRYDPAIYFSGFCSQGDGARFEGSYEYPGKGKNPAKAIRAYAGGDSDSTKKLYAIADTLQELQQRNFYGLSAQIGHRGGGEHEMCADIDTYKTVNSKDREVSEDDQDALQETLRDFMRWIYRSLEAEYEYLMSDETVDDNMVANEYEFEEDGTRH